MTQKALVLMLLLISMSVSAESISADKEFFELFTNETVVIEGAEFCLPMTLYLARTGAQKRRGLMFVRSMARDTGMLFYYKPASKMSMWMKNTIIPLDIIFLDQEGTLINVRADAEPYSLKPLGSTAVGSYALELNAGRAKELALAPGMRILIPDFLPD